MLPADTRPGDVLSSIAGGVSGKVRVLHTKEGAETPPAILLILFFFLLVTKGNTFFCDHKACKDPEFFLGVLLKSF